MTIYRMFLLLFMVAGNNIVTASPFDQSLVPLYPDRIFPAVPQDEMPQAGFLTGFFLFIATTSLSAERYALAAIAGLGTAFMGGCAMHKINKTKKAEKRKKMFMRFLGFFTFGFLGTYFTLGRNFFSKIGNEQAKTISEDEQILFLN